MIGRLSLEKWLSSRLFVLSVIGLMHEKSGTIYV